MANSITYIAAGMSYAAFRWNSSNGVVDTARAIVQDISSVIKLPFTLRSLAKEADVNYEQCMEQAKEINEAAGWILSVKSLMYPTVCEGYKYQSVFYGLGAFYALCKLLPYARSIFNLISKGKRLVTSRERKVVEKQNLTQEIQFCNMLIQNHGLVAKEFSYDREQGLVLKTTTTGSLEELSDQLEEIQAKIVEIEDENEYLVALKIERNGYTIEVTL